MRRKIYDRLLKWKNEDRGTSAVMIDGARRVGKSYIAEEFARNEYKSYILIDFNKASSEVRNLFDTYLDDLDTFFVFLSGYYGVPLYERETLIILDEVQFFPRARSAVKYLVADGRYDYLETGSLLSIRENVKNILIPYEERHFEMFPMDFEEFLWAMGNTELMPLIRMCFEKKKPLGPLHRTAMDWFRQYLIVGGMPQVVEAYSQGRDFPRVDRLKRDILQLYRDDIAKHANGNAVKVRAIFDQIPSQLSQHEKKFKITSLSKDAKSRDYEESFFWLSDAMIVNNCYNSTEPNLGLRLNRDNSVLKCYMGDTGLLISLAFDEKGLVDEEIYKKILFGKLEINEGMIMENIVSQMLRASGRNLYFYTKYSREGEDRMEIDFLIAKRTITNRHNISVLEVKSGKRYTLSSLEKYSKKFSEYTDRIYVIHTLDYQEKDGIVYLPIYMTPLL